MTQTRTVPAPPDDLELDDERSARTVRAERLADYVKRVVAAMPPLSDEQVDELAMLLRGGAT